MTKWSTIYPNQEGMTQNVNDLVRSHVRLSLAGGLALFVFFHHRSTPSFSPSRCISPYSFFFHKTISQMKIKYKICIRRKALINAPIISNAFRITYLSQRTTKYNTLKRITLLSWLDTEYRLDDDELDLEFVDFFFSPIAQSPLYLDSATRDQSSR